MGEFGSRSARRRDLVARGVFLEAQVSYTVLPGVCPFPSRAIEDATAGLKGVALCGVRVYHNALLKKVEGLIPVRTVVLEGIHKRESD